MSPHTPEDRFEQAVARAADEPPEIGAYVPPWGSRRVLPLRELLDFELATQDITRPQKSARIRALGMSPVRYYQSLNAAMDNPDALAAEPQLIYRLRKQRARRLAERAARTFHPR